MAFRHGPQQAGTHGGDCCRAGRGGDVVPRRRFDGDKTGEFVEHLPAPRPGTRTALHGGSIDRTRNCAFQEAGDRRLDRYLMSMMYSAYRLTRQCCQRQSCQLLGAPSRQCLD
jgi:hypothetical protein